MSLIRYELHAYRRISLYGYEPHPYRVLASGVLTATTTTASAPVTVPESGDDRIALVAVCDTTMPPANSADIFLSFLGLAEPGQTPRPDQDPRFMVNGVDGAVRLMVRSGQRFSILDSGRKFATLGTAA